MKKCRINNISIHTIPITDEKKAEINYAFSKIYARYISAKLNEMQISNKKKTEIIKSIMNK